MTAKPSMRKGHIDRSHIRKAKAVPISEILGRDKMIVRPFHKDIVQSLSISHEKGVWHCFGCGKGGDVIALVMEMEGLDFLGAVRGWLKLIMLPDIFISLIKQLLFFV